MPTQQTTSSWVQLTGADLRTVLQALIVLKADESVSVDTQPDDPLDPGATDKRTDLLVAYTVAQFRAAIQAAGRFPLSVLPAAVPNVSVSHVLYTAAWSLITSTPNVQMVVVGEQPVAKRFYDDACKHLEGLRRGEPVDQPSDPTGRDYLTAADDDTTSDTYNPSICLVSWADMYGTGEQYAQGWKWAPNGTSVIVLPVSDMTVN